MSNYSIQPIDLTGLRTVPLKARGGKVRIDDFAGPYVKNSGVLGVVQSMPRILAGDSFRLALCNSSSTACSEGACGWAPPSSSNFFSRSLVSSVAPDGPAFGFLPASP